MDSRSARSTTASWARNEMAKKGEDGMVLGPRTRQDVAKKKAPSLLLPAHTPRTGSCQPGCFWRNPSLEVLGRV